MKRKVMTRAALVAIIFGSVTTANATTIATKGYVDGAVTMIDTDKQDTIAGGTVGQVVTYSGTAGTVGALAVDTTVTTASSNLVTSGAVDTAVTGKQDAISAGTAGNVVTYSGTAGTVGSLAVDTTVTAASSNLVTSGAVDTAVDTVSSKFVATAANQLLISTDALGGTSWVDITSDTYGG